MGSISGRKALQVIENVEKILAIELLTAAQAFSFRSPNRSSSFIEGLYELIREHISFVETDRVFAGDIEKSLNLIKGNELWEYCQGLSSHHADLTKDHDQNFTL